MRWSKHTSGHRSGALGSMRPPGSGRLHIALLILYLGSAVAAPTKHPIIIASG